MINFKRIKEDIKYNIKRYDEDWLLIYLTDLNLNKYILYNNELNII